MTSLWVIASDYGCGAKRRRSFAGRERKTTIDRQRHASGVNCLSSLFHFCVWERRSQAGQAVPHFLCSVINGGPKHYTHVHVSDFLYQTITPVPHHNPIHLPPRARWLGFDGADCQLYSSRAFLFYHEHRCIQQLGWLICLCFQLLAYFSHDVESHVHARVHQCGVLSAKCQLRKQKREII